MTMTFAVMGIGTAFNAVVNRRDPTSGVTPPILKAVAIALIPVAMVFLATELPTLQRAVRTVPLSTQQWLACFGLAAVLPIVVELWKVLRRRHDRASESLGAETVVAPEWARSVRP
jgi:Ca2+-transporting ATPase